MIIGSRGKPGDARVDDDETRTAAHHVDDRVTEKSVRVRSKRRFTPNHDAFGIHKRRVFVAPRQTSRIVYFRVRASQVVRRSRHARYVAGIARLRIAHVGRPQHIGAVGAERTAFAACSHKKDNAFASVFRRDAPIIVLDDVECFFPGATLPFVRLAPMLRVALQGIGDATRIVHEILERQAAHAQAALRDLLVLVPLDFDQLALVVHIQLDAASDRMAPRWRPRRTAYNGAAVLFPLPRFTQIVDLAERRKRNGRLCLHVLHGFPPFLTINTTDIGIGRLRASTARRPLVHGSMEADDLAIGPVGQNAMRPELHVNPRGLIWMIRRGRRPQQRHLSRMQSRRGRRSVDSSARPTPRRQRLPPASVHSRCSSNVSSLQSVPAPASATPDATVVACCSCCSNGAYA